MFWWWCVLSIVVCAAIHWVFKSTNKLKLQIKGVPLVPIELSYLRDYSFVPGQYNLVIPIEISFLKNYSFSIFVNNLKQVLQTIQKKHPFLQASVVSENSTLDINDKWYFTWDHKNEIPFKIIDSDNYEKVMKQELHTAFPLKGPMIRATLCKNEKMVLILTAFHLILDGATLLHLVKEIMQLLGQMNHSDVNTEKHQEQIALMEAITPRPIPKSLVEQLDTKQHASTLGNWIFFFQFLYMQFKQIGFKAITFPLVPVTERRELKSDFVIFELDKEITNRILATAKQHNVSMSSLLSAASALVASKFISLPPSNPIIPVPVPLDLRRNVPSVKNTVEDVRALSTGIFLFLKLSKNVWDMALAAQEQIRQLVKSDFAIRFFQLYQILPKISRGGDDNKCLVCSSFPPIPSMDTDQFESTIRGLVMSTHNTTNMVSVYLLTVKEKFLVNVWYNSSVQKEPVLQFAKSLEEFMQELACLDE